MLSATMARFSSQVVRSTSVAWKAEALPTMVIHPVPACTSAASPWSSAALTPLRRVMPKAATRVAPRSMLATFGKYSASFSLEAGYPPSTNSNPRLASRLVSKTLS